MNSLLSLHKQMVLFLYLILCPGLGAAEEYRLYTSFQTPDVQLAKAILSEAFQRAGHGVSFERLPFRRSLATANRLGDGEVMRVANITEIDPEITSNLIAVYEPLLEVPVFLVSNTNRRLIQQEDLKHSRVGFLKGIRILEELVPDGIAVENYSTLYKMLKLKRLDAVLTSEFYTEELTRHPDFSDDFNVSIISRIDTYTFIHIKHEKLLPKLAAALKSMKTDGTYPRLKEEIRLIYYPGNP